MTKDSQTSILAPFGDEDQALLRQVDLACRAEAARLKEEAKKKALANEEFQVDMETMAWFKIIQAYGILYNRAVDAGWIQDILLEKNNG